MTPAQASSQGSLQVLVQMASSASSSRIIALQGMRRWKKMKMMMLNSKSAMPRCVAMQRHAVYAICAGQKSYDISKTGASDIAIVYDLDSILVGAAQHLSLPCVQRSSMCTCCTIAVVN